MKVMLFSPHNACCGAVHPGVIARATRVKRAGQSILSDREQASFVAWGRSGFVRAPVGRCATLSLPSPIATYIAVLTLVLALGAPAPDACLTRARGRRAPHVRARKYAHVSRNSVDTSVGVIVARGTTTPRESGEPTSTASHHSCVQGHTRARLWRLRKRQLSRHQRGRLVVTWGAPASPGP